MNAEGPGPYRPADAPPPEKKTRAVEAILLPVLTAVVLVALWHAAVRLSHTDVFPSPFAVALGLGELARKGVLGIYVRDSLVRVAAGYSLALVLGIPTGIALGWYSGAARAINSDAARRGNVDEILVTNAPHSRHPHPHPHLRR